MALAQLLWIGTVLQVFLEAVLSDVRGLADRADGRLVDGGGAVVCHVCFLCLFWSIGFGGAGLD